MRYNKAIQNYVTCNYLGCADVYKRQDYHGEGPVLYARSVEPAQEIKDVVQF